MLKCLTIVACLACGCSAAVAQCGGGDIVTGLPDLDHSIVSWGLSAGESATLLVLPDGSGEPLTAARRPDGTPVDATIRLHLVDACGYGIAFFPREDMWIESTDQGLVACLGGTCPDTRTDLYGFTSWSAPLQAGGHSQASCRVLVNGTPMSSPAGLPLHFVSADINGDRQVDLVDVSAFAQAYPAPYAFVADLQANGAVNLADIAVLARSLGIRCP
jgi:hypothetical protein